MGQPIRCGFGKASDSYRAFVEYVEVWNRALKKTMVDEVMWEIKHEETKLYPLYEDLEQRVAQLREELKK